MTHLLAIFRIYRQSITESFVCFFRPFLLSYKSRAWGFRQQGHQQAHLYEQVIPADTIAPSPMTTPGRIVEFAPIMTSSPMITSPNRYS